MKETQQRGGAGLVLAGASLWGLIGLFNRALLGAGLGPESIVLVRNLGGLVVLALVLAVWKREAFRVQGKHLGWFFGTGVVSVVFFTWCYFSCQEQCSLAVAAILLYTSPAFVVLLSALLWRDKITKRKLLALGLTFFVPPIFTGIAFDSGGVASGPMTATFLLPFAQGACQALGGDVMTDAFGIVAMVAMTPLVTIQIMGLSSVVRHSLARRRFRHRMEQVEDVILYFDGKEGA